MQELDINKKMAVKTLVNHDIKYAVRHIGTVHDSYYGVRHCLEVIDKGSKRLVITDKYGYVVFGDYHNIVNGD